jgi:hypothetical protein
MRLLIEKYASVDVMQSQMKIVASKDIGRIIRQKRKDDGLTLEEAAVGP